MKTIELNFLFFGTHVIYAANALKTSRYIPRKRRRLASGGLVEFAVESKNLLLQLSNFCDAVHFLSFKNHLAIEDLCFVNKITTNIAGADYVRKVQNWLGASLKTLTIILQLTQRQDLTHQIALYRAL